MKAFILAILAAAATASAPRRSYGYGAPAKQVSRGYNSFGGHAGSLKGGFGGYGAPAKRPVKRSSKGSFGGYGSGSFQGGKGSFGGFKGVQGGFSKGGYGAPSKGGYGQSLKSGYGQSLKGGYGQSLKGGYGQSRKSGYGQARKGAGFGLSRKGFGGYGAPQKGGYQASASYTAFDDHNDDIYGESSGFEGRFGAKGNPAIFSQGDVFGTENLSLGAFPKQSYDFSLDNIGHQTPDFSKQQSYNFSLENSGYGKSPYGKQGGFSLDKIGYTTGGKGFKSGPNFGSVPDFNPGFSLDNSTFGGSGNIVGNIQPYNPGYDKQNFGTGYKAPSFSLPKGDWGGFTSYGKGAGW